MDPFRRKVKDEVLAARRGPFGGWWEDLLEVDPHLLLRVHRQMAVAESGPLPKSFRHLILATVDSVVTHLYPRGIGVHARVAIEHGASLRQVVEALEISAFVSNRSREWSRNWQEQPRRNHGGQGAFVGHPQPVRAPCG
ncbi:hypothetical protein MPL1032_240283 [Mesorhizobium plurifarium]|uniref:Carboxymuconolactone decarboxylase-like domain-containing protein n=1 Tax=Mesorhizobium plurifarium TaxID=69974 RepID=A0A0K2W0V5_MESPL|nr:hypothetical protein MPL1032_240283 [Mesorhizobium plurifarium]